MIIFIDNVALLCYISYQEVPLEQRLDWQEVVDRQPRGYLELNDGYAVLHGPIESIKVNDDDQVVISLKWMACVLLGSGGVPNGEWIAINEKKPIVFMNGSEPFIFEQTPNKGERVRFGMNILYLTEVGFGPECVKGLVPVSV